MKRIQTAIAGLALSALLFTGCEKGFDDLNTNKVDPVSLDPQFVMNKGIIDATYRDNFATLQWLCYDYGIVQQIITPFGSSLAGANYNIFNPGVSSQVWVNFYQSVLKQVVDVIEKTKGNAQRSNLYNQARIWKCYAFMIVTDTYGDVPYTEASRGYLNEISQPKYDKQEAIYKDILKELDEASAALDPAKATSVADILYGGNIARWKRLGYSLMLRAGMRLCRVDPATARTYVAKAVAGGLMQSNADNSVMRHTSLYQNWVAVHLTAREKANFYIAKPFVDFLKNNNDPRLRVISVRHVGARTGAEQTAARLSTDPAVQIGMPMGYDDVSIRNTFATFGVASLYDYSQVNLSTILKTDAPEFHVTYAQTQLLLAEAIVRGWATGNADATYKSGIRAHMEQMAQYDISATIPPASIQTYLDANTLVTGRELEQINNQYWVASFINGSETYANFRRSGFPRLTKNPYPGSEIKGNFINRIPYPDSEIITNLGNLNEAVKNQGPNDLNSKVWWDSK
jgi:hypothetical protein